MKRVLFLLLVSVFMLPAFHQRSTGTRNTNSDSLSGANQTINNDK